MRGFQFVVQALYDLEDSVVISIKPQPLWTGKQVYAYSTCICAQLVYACKVSLCRASGLGSRKRRGHHPQARAAVDGQAGV
jgi:hypothetical protein